MALFKYAIWLCTVGGWTANGCAQNSAEFTTAIVACTPCDSLVKRLLQIPAGEKCDFIRWNLLLMDEVNSKTYDLDINYGEAKPNTSGFKNNGKTMTLKGEYGIEENAKLNGKIYNLKSGEATISFISVSKNLFHLLTPGNELMVGNGGWSYTLNREHPLSDSGIHSIVDPVLINDSALQVIYEGRTPCQELVKRYGIEVDKDCYKLKWKLTLLKDPVTHLPKKYILNSTLSRHKNWEGTWKIIHGNEWDPNLVMFQLEGDDGKLPIRFLAGDKNVLFFTDKEGRLLVGNERFSYTMNRRE